MSVILGPLFALIDIVLGLYVWVLIFTVAVSWLISFNVLQTANRAVYVVADILYRLTEPLLAPIRRFLPNLGGLDISPLVLLLGIWFVRDVLRRLAFQVGA